MENATTLRGTGTRNWGGTTLQLRPGLGPTDVIHTKSVKQPSNWAHHHRIENLGIVATDQAGLGSSAILGKAMAELSSYNHLHIRVILITVFDWKMLKAIEAGNGI